MKREESRSKSYLTWLPILASTLVLVFLVLRYGARWLRFWLIYLSHAGWARNTVSNVSLAKRVARRFVAGETIEEAIAVSRELNARGIAVTLDYLGESVNDVVESSASRDEILRLLDSIAQSGIDANVSVKLSQLGLRIEYEVALENMRQILARARQYDNKIRIDMEESDLVDDTLDIYQALRDIYGFENVGVVIQAYLYRSEADTEKLIEEGAWVRLCKGAYAEPPEIAFAKKASTDVNFVRLTALMLSDEARANGVYLGVATHDQNMIDATIELTKAEGISPDSFEFQMLYGIRQELQAWLIGQGYRLRVYVPYGTAWYPYLVRRLAERPANLWFFVSNLLRR